MSFQNPTSITFPKCDFAVRVQPWSILIVELESRLKKIGKLSLNRCPSAYVKHPNSSFSPKNNLLQKKLIEYD